MINMNFIERIIDQAEKSPNREALNIPIMEGGICIGNDIVTYKELMILVSRCQKGWDSIGLEKGGRVIVLIKPSVKLYVTVLSLLGLGLVPVFIDTGMGLKKIKMAMKDSKATVIVSMNLMLKKFWLIPPLWFLKRYSVDGASVGVKSFEGLFIGDGRDRPRAVRCSEKDHGLISFTSGSTGRPKGADRTHQSLHNQHLAIRAHWQDNEGDVDFPCFPVVVLHNLSCGMRTVLPNVDFSSPGNVDSDKIIHQLEKNGITRMSGAPAYMGRIVDALLLKEKTILNVESVVVGGSTVPMSLVKGMAKVFPNAVSRVVYGSTEAEPIASVNILELLNDDGKENGYLVGKCSDDVEILISIIPDKPVSESVLKDREVKRGEVGEIVVSGKHVLKAYVDNQDATLENKISRDNGLVWHRTGDVGFLDEQDRIWLTGRVKDIVKVNEQWVSPYIIEKQVDEMPGVRRCALMQVEKSVCFVLEASERDIPVEVDTQQLRVILKKDIQVPISVYLVERLPVDGRHNSKIDRPLVKTMIKNKRLKKIATWD